MNRLLNLFKGWDEAESVKAVQVETADRREDARWEALGTVSLKWIDEKNNHQSIEAALIERSPDGLRVVAPREFRVGTELLVELPKGTEEKAAVRHHAKSETGWQLGLRLIHNERRRFPRFAVDGKAVLHWTADRHGHRSVDIEVKNVAEDGMQVRANEPVPPGTAVKISGIIMECVGVTWYCRPDEDHFLIGVQMSRAPYDRDGLDFREF